MSCLSAIARQEYYIELGNTLPEPVADTQERHELRMRTAVEAFTALKPGNAWEGRLAVDIVLSGAFAAECLRKARASSDDFAKEKCHLAQAASLKREYRAALKVLREEQRQRLATEAVAEAVAQ